jgi:hypothetical protein
MNEIQHCLDLRSAGSDPEGCAAALAVRNFGTLIRNGGSVYGQPDCRDALYLSEIEVFLIRVVETAQKTTRFLSEWHMSW